MADIKSLLKEARKLIDEKNFEEAQECCKNILRKDKQNYFALVLLGKSLQDSDQAPLAYQKAIASKPDQPLGWQGLANYYERKDDTTAKTKLFAIYDEILKLQVEEEKTLEIITKLGQLGCALKNHESIQILTRYLTKDNNIKIVEVAEKQFINILKMGIVCNEEELPHILNILHKILAKESSESIEILIGKIIIQKNDFIAAANGVMNLNFFSRNVVVREMLCQYLCKKYVENETFSDFPVENYIDRITNGIENSKYPGLLKSMICYEKELYLEAYKQCVPLVNYQEADITEASFIIRCTIQLKKWPLVQKLTTNFLTKVKDKMFCIDLKKYLFLALAKQNKWKQAIHTVKDIPFQLFDMTEQAIYAECLIEENLPVEHVLQNLKTTEHYTTLSSLLLMKQGKYKETIKLFENVEENSLSLFYLGKAYWEINELDKCHINLIKAAKLDSEHAHTFLYLGHIYNYHKKDLEKAKKCYEKAYSINNTDNNIIKSLSEIYIELNLKDADYELLNTAEKTLQNNESWLNFRLGLRYLNKREWENAIFQFRNVIKIDRNNTTALECLADAYYSRGSFTSALRAYNKVMKLNPSKKSYCLTRIGYINTLLTQHDEAILTFNEVLNCDPFCLLALKGISETLMRVAKKKEAAKMYGCARDCAQNAINFITRAITVQKKYSCFWKLLADSLMFVTKLPNKYVFIDIRKSYDDNNAEIIRKGKHEIFLEGISCYAYIAKQRQQIATYDLASAYIDFYLATKQISNCHISFNLTIACIKDNSASWQNWDLLGKICFLIKKYDIAQHCFIKALLVTRKWSVAKIWCSLGTLYLKLKLYKLSNYCYWRGQSTLPSYPPSWIGQGLIAEAIREEEAMDLFRHASRLGYHPESALGYADWVCRTLRNLDYKDDPDTKYIIDALYAIPYAIDLVEWYLHFDPNNACAFTILGILQERFGLIHTAIKSHEKALEYAENDKKNIVLLNIGRVLVRLEKYEEAIKVYKAITEASLNSASGLALALYKNGLYEESYSAYDTALHWLSNEDVEKSDLLVAMSGIVYMYKGADDAKTLLFHSIQISQKKPTACSLFAICSLGLIHTDQSLYKLALSELQKYDQDSKLGFDIGFLKSYIMVSENNMEDAIKSLSDSLHDHPSNTLLWYFMAQYCLRASSNKAKAASHCAQRALCSAYYVENNSDSGKIVATASVAEHVAGNQMKALMLAKAGLHMYPHQAEIWAALLLSILSQKIWTERKDWILSAAGHVRRHLNITRPLSSWVGFLEKKLKK